MIITLIAVFLVSFSFAAEQKLASNFIFAVMPSVKNGEFRAISKGESISAIDEIEVNFNSEGLQFGQIKSYAIDKELSLVHDLLLSDNTGKYRKSLWIYDENKTTLYMPYYGKRNGYFTKTMGIAEFKNGIFAYKTDYANDSIPLAIDNTPKLFYEQDSPPKIDTIKSIPVAINSVAQIGNETFSAALGLESNHSFLIKNLGRSDQKILEMPNSEFVVAVADFPITSTVQGLALATYGNGILVSADTGTTWKNLMNRTSVGNNLGSIRVIPSVLRGAGTTSLIAYKVSETSKISIEVFSYDMRKIRTIVKDATRDADPIRSTNSSEDFWDGKDDFGRNAALGTYYIRVRDNHGNTGWGKVMCLGAN